MTENGFVPFSPRRLHTVVVDDFDDDVVAAVIASEATEIAAAQLEMQPEAVFPEDPPGTEHLELEFDAARIRAAAIGLAAAACARALRYAVDRNPRLLARFVDDALRAAGSPQHATVRLAPSAAMAGCVPGEHDYVADASLSPCDVFVDCADGTLGATIEQRADGLVRAVAS